MSGGLVTAAYIVAAILFIFSLAGLSKHETSRQGNNFGIAGMAIALLATIFGPDTGNVAWILVAMIIGGAIGIRMAKKVEMTEMPELVAILHSFVGLAAVLVGFNSYLYHDASLAPVLVNIHLTEVFLGIFIGAVTFTGSIVAFGKLRGKISSKPLMLPNRHKMNLAALVVSFLLLLVFVRTESVGLQVLALLLMTIIALAFGWHLVASIGGADMPVVVSMLNSYSGWAAAAAGFMLSNDLLIVTGALVGSSGAILSYIMCKAMNRSFISVIAGGFGTDGSSTGDDQEGCFDTLELHDLENNTGLALVLDANYYRDAQTLEKKVQLQGKCQLAALPSAGVTWETDDNGFVVSATGKEMKVEYRYDSEGYPLGKTTINSQNTLSVTAKPSADPRKKLDYTAVSRVDDRQVGNVTQSCEYDAYANPVDCRLVIVDESVKPAVFHHYTIKNRIDYY
ncbi:TPA_asm: YnfC family lipoprotein [Salmonella enterica subsp. enterica serovar Enteritidis]|nr:YnfC family lipoprotein [Salmonella enterica subsp. enterica serovar Enteritidis]